MFRLAPLSTRNQFGQLLNDMGLLSEAVEIGTHRGEFAKVILDSWQGKKLHCVDPWAVPKGYEDQAKLLWGGAANRKEDFEAAKAVHEFHPGRMGFYMMQSEDAVTEFASNSVDFVYVDGDHRYDYVLSDLSTWWGKIKPGGVLAGHDWIQPGESHSWANEIQQALRVFVDNECVSSEDGKWERDLDVQLIVEEGNLPWSYYLIKPPKD